MPAQSSVFNTRTPLGRVVACDLQVCGPYVCKYKHAQRQPSMHAHHARIILLLACLHCKAQPLSLVASRSGEPCDWGSPAARLHVCVHGLPACLPACMLPAACRPPDCLAARLPTYLPPYLHRKQQPLPSGSSYTLLAKLAAPTWRVWLPLRWSSLRAVL